MRSYVDFCGKLKSWISSAKQYNYLSDTFCIKSFYRSFVIFSQCLRCFSGSTRYIRYSLRSQFCVRWNSYQSNLQSAFPKLLTSEHFVDVTLACENEMLKCHKVVLSACSAYFEKLLLDNPYAIVGGLYALQIRGLCGSDQLLNPAYFNTIKQQTPQAQSTQETKLQPSQIPLTKVPDIPIKKEQNQVPEEDIEEEPEESFFDGDSELMDQEMTEEDGPVNTEASGGLEIKPQFAAIANVSCHYDATTANRRIRRSDEELRRAAECITRGQTFQTVSDQFNIPISTIRFYMARKGILPRRKRGRACAGGSLGGLGGLGISPTSGAALGGLAGMSGGAAQVYASPASPIGPPYHIVHYKLPALGVSKLK
ncbi:unnamed protein product [Callosobruchus maculatus]|uniref:BTB domain-containing protein n=1 Tax=Callosobruchus maculatus TaxID=64391 RepID=A0A653C7P5_CALMS|nr:unnamed protein product [Callosobruchus maculatus]